jgi:hypothetical protein
VRDVRRGEQFADDGEITTVDDLVRDVPNQLFVVLGHFSTSASIHGQGFPNPILTS